jgi:hypothetical protein
MYKRLYVFMDVLICTVFSVLFILSYDCDYIQTTAVSILCDEKLRMYAPSLVIVK